eukprot:293642_1
MLAHAYLSHVSNIEDFEDSNDWYRFHEETINYDIFSKPSSIPSAPAKITYNYLGTPSATNTISIPMTPPSTYGNTPTIKVPVIIKSKKEEELIERFTKHNEVCRELVKMALILSPDTITNANNVEFTSNIECAFYLPSAQNNNKYVCKIVDYVSFNDCNDVIEFILTEFWEESFAQTIFDKLVSWLTIAQKCKLLSIGIEPY